MTAWMIEALQVTGGFLDGIALRLPARPSLTCIIGPRGTGKSTLIEALRYALGAVQNADKSRIDLIQANLASALIALRTTPDAVGRQYVVTRRSRGEPMVTTADGRPLGEVDIGRGSFLPLDAFSSQEIEQLADASFGTRRRALLDELQNPDFRELLQSLMQLRRELEGNADSIRACESRARDLQEEILQIGDVQARLDSLPSPPADQGTTLLTAAAQQRQLDGKEAANIRSALSRLEKLATQIATLSAEAQGVSRLAVSVDGSANASVTQRIDALLRTVGESVVRDFATTQDVALRGHEQMRLIEAELTSLHNQHEVSLRDLQGKSANATAIVQERLDAQQAVQKLQSLVSERKRIELQLNELRAHRANLKGRYLLERERVSQAREQVATNLSVDAGKRVRIQVFKNADALAYKQLLVNALRGSGVRGFEEISETLLHLRPEELADVVNRNALDELAAQTGFASERSRRILDAFRSNLDTFALEIVEAEDRVGIELNVGSEIEPNFKDAAMLSRGQKCTALLPMLLARRDVPLVIDQPEDNLDNHFIFETVVEAILRQKIRRQMVFVTHNANIPVLGAADLVVVMDSDGTRGVVTKSGTVDECRGEIVDLLEGGKKAFDLRRLRYGY